MNDSLRAPMRLTGWRRVGFVAVILLLVLPLVSARALVSGSLTPTQLGGFEIDGNMQVDSGTYDWSNAGGSGGPTTCTNLAAGHFANVGGPLSLFCATDTPSGTQDNSLNGHEQDLTVRVVCGSIPNGKSDLSNFYVASQSVGGHSVLYLAWAIASTGGSADMDFEFNKLPQPAALDTTTSGCPSGSGTTINVGATRSPGDLLIEYQFQSGGNAVSVKLAQWTTTTGAACATSQSPPCWGPETDLTASSTANGAINDASTSGVFVCGGPQPSKMQAGCITNTLSGGTLGPDQFGEAGVDLTAANVFPSGTCETFGSAYLKSRSSAVFTDEVKDYIAPVPVHITNCVTPPVTTLLSSSTASLGSTVTDTATVSNFLGTNPPGGTVAFNVYSGTGSNACTGTPVETLPTGASADGTNGDHLTAGAGTTATATETITSGTTLPPGHYEVQAVYTGDGGQNKGSSSACGNEPLQINKVQPTIATQTSPTSALTVGTRSTISDTATFSNVVSGKNPTGSVNFTLYTDAACTTAATYAAGDGGTGSVTGSGSISGTSATFTTTWTPTISPDTTATYTWGISYAGDGNYLKVPTTGTVQCGGPYEVLTVAKASPGVSTRMHLDDTATLTGSPTPSGTVTFKLYNAADCDATTGTLVAEFDNVAISSGTASTVGLTPNAGGSTLVNSGVTYSWKVTYSGDHFYSGVTIGCTTANHETAAISYAFG